MAGERVIPRRCFRATQPRLAAVVERKTGSGTPQPPYRNMGDSDLSMTENAAIDSRTSLGLSFDTPARLGRNALNTDRGTYEQHERRCCRPWLL